MPFQLSQKAYQDLKEIARHTEQNWGTEQRNSYLAKLDTCFYAIAKSPSIGQGCNHIKRGYYRYLIGRHVVFYKIEDNIVFIVRILHQNMDIKTRL